MQHFNIYMLTALFCLLQPRPFVLGYLFRRLHLNTKKNDFNRNPLQVECPVKMYSLVFCQIAADEIHKASNF